VPHNRAWPLALLLCPTRELALQQAAQASKLVAGSQLAVKCVTGQAPIAQQVLELRRGAADLLVATPGRLLDLLGKRAVSLGRVKFLVSERRAAAHTSHVSCTMLESLSTHLARPPAICDTPTGPGGGR
jgi:ERCC4-related helicase